MVTVVCFPSGALCEMLHFEERRRSLEKSSLGDMVIVIVLVSPFQFVVVVLLDSIM